MSEDWERYYQLGEKALSEGNYFDGLAWWLAAHEEASEFRFDDPRLRLTLEGLAETYWKQAKFAKAEPLCKRLVQICESACGPDHCDVGIAANNLGLLCQRQGKFTEASILYQQAQAILERVVGGSHPDVLLIRKNLAEVRRLTAQQIELKVDQMAGRWTKSGSYKAIMHHPT